MQDTISVPKRDHHRHPSATPPPPASIHRLLLLAQFARNRAETSEAAQREFPEDFIARGCTATRTRVLLLNVRPILTPLPIARGSKLRLFTSSAGDLLPGRRNFSGFLGIIKLRPTCEQRERERERRRRNETLAGKIHGPGGRKSCGKNVVTELMLALFTGYI